MTDLFISLSLWFWKALQNKSDLSQCCASQLFLLCRFVGVVKPKRAMTVIYD